MPPIEQSFVDDGLCTAAEAAEFLGISRGKLYQLMEQGELRYCKLGRNRRVLRSKHLLPSLLSANPPSDNCTSPPSTIRQRRREAERAERELEQMGI